MPTLFSLKELIAASGNMLSIHTIKDYCRRGELHPCIYFEGNIVCIYHRYYENIEDKREAGVHSDNVSWSKIFKGYLSASNFIDYLDCQDSNACGVFYNVEKIIECIVPRNEVPTLKPNESLRAFPPNIDDGLREIRWLNESYGFEGNNFRAADILFHNSEVNVFLKTFNESNLMASFDSTNFEDPLSEINYLRCKVAQQEAEIEKLKSANNDVFENTKNISDDKINFTGLGEYSTPTLEAIKGVIREFWLPYNPEIDIPPKQNTVMDWIAINYPEFSKYDSIRRSIDKICRHPKAKIGGRKKFQQKKLIV
ncbi:hypothetical protein EC844_12424 [Acinetobacter calcoaceticus]|uniref:Uncharacterized protein n=1 Tax=Acinetobacter calcoaceticus TaxID=471 RepID=A0A4R1XHK2_ACICA|nr:hypothetical protein EC844_12424 [Acinetobacter calcoaceticus]